MNLLDPVRGTPAGTRSATQAPVAPAGVRAGAPIGALCGVLAVLAAGLGLAGCQSEGRKVDEDRQLEIYIDMARGFYDLGELDRAKDQALKGLELDGDNRELLLILGRSMLRTGSRQEIGGAEQIFRDLLTEDDYRTHLGLAVALERKGQFFDEAAREIASGDRFTEAEDVEVRVAQLNAGALAAWQESTEHYRRVVELHAGDRDALNGLQRVYSLMDRPEDAWTWSQTLIDSLSEQLVFYRLQLQRPEIRASEEEYLRARERGLVRLLVETRFFAYTLLAGMGRNEDAIAELDAVLKLDESLTEAYSRRAQLWHEEGEYDRAIHDLDRFLRLSKLEFDHPDVQRAYGLRTVCEAALAKGDS